MLFSCFDVFKAVKCGNKVLCCAPSNVAVDNLLEKLAGNNLRLIRLGHPARVHQRLQNYSLDARISSSEQTKIVRMQRGEYLIKCSLMLRLVCLGSRCQTGYHHDCG